MKVTSRDMLISRTDGKAPDGYDFETPRILAGTWGGRCGATKWITPHKYGIWETCVDQGNTDNSQVHTTQAWFRNSRRPPPGWQGSEEPTPGYRVECKFKNRHDGPHGFELGSGVQVTWGSAVEPTCR
jgi:hypothetical protein